MARPRTLNRSVLQAALEGFEAQRARLDQEIRAVRKLMGVRAPAAAAAPAETVKPARRKRRRLSAEARKRIGEAQRRRWAAFRKKNA